MGRGWGWGGWGWGWGSPWGFVLGWLSVRRLRLWGRLLLPLWPGLCGWYPQSDYMYPYADNGQSTANDGPHAHAHAHANAHAHAAQTSETPDASGNEGLQYYNDARSAFGQGEYRNAMRLAGHSAVESPQNPKVHELLSLASFASGNYLAAATEAHAALLGSAQ